jgi:hypothetical protein
MTNMDKRAGEREALERLLDIYGADRTRWPARERLKFAGVISEDDAAGRMVAEAAALDRLLDVAPRASTSDVNALTERIMAAALRSAPPQLSVVGSPKASSAPAARYRLDRREWPAAAMLAASLVLGVMLGSAGTFDTPVQGVAEVAGYSDTAEGSQYALLDYIDGQGDEDLL